MSASISLTTTSVTGTLSSPQPTSTHNDPQCFPQGVDAQGHHWNCYINNIITDNETAGGIFSADSEAGKALQSTADKCCKDPGNGVGGDKLVYMTDCGFSCLSNNKTKDPLDIFRSWDDCMSDKVHKNWSWGLGCWDATTKKSDAAPSRNPLSLKSGLMWAGALFAVGLVAG